MKREPGLARSLACVAVALSAAPSFAGTVIHVNGATGDDANTGEDWTHAKQTVTAGLAAAVSGDQVWVAAGTYVECITLKDGVELYGGFAGNETELTQRNWVMNKTILDGNQSGSVVTSPAGATTSTRIDGFTIRNGTGTVSEDYRYGGGIYCYSSSPTIANNTITANTATGRYDIGYGGGIYCYASSPTIMGNAITGNTASHAYGGAIAIESGASPTIEDNDVTRNTASLGGGIYSSSSSPVIAKNTIADNVAYPTGDPPGYGGGIYCTNSTATVANNTIVRNAARDGWQSNGTGGGIFCSSSSVTIAHNTIEENTGGVGGGIAGSFTSSTTITSNSVARNTASNSGGGIFCTGDPATLTNNTVTANSARTGGGIHFFNCRPIMMNSTIAGNAASSYGGGVYCTYASPTITNSTIAGNGAASDGGGVYGDNSSYLTIMNTIISFNSSGVYGVRGYGQRTKLRYNCVYGNVAYNYGSRLVDPTGTEGNISADPGLADYRYGNCHLEPGSPCIDAGDDSVAQANWLDMDGQPRLQGPHVDIGADESDGTTWPQGPYAIVRVSSDGDDANDGLSWGAPKRTVQAAIDLASAVRGDVWVKAGTYLERITLRAYAYLYGGFDGTETARDQRDFRVHATILDGQQGGSVVTVQSGGYRLSTIDGFTIRNGTGTSLGTYSRGGGIVCLDGGSPLIVNNTITENVSTEGGGIYCRGFPKITNNAITANRASSGGGGIQCYYYSSATIADNTITGNSAASGGGICCSYYSSAAIVRNTIAANTSSNGGGITCKDSSPMIANNAILSNAATDGGGIYCHWSHATIANNTIERNTASSQGGGVYCSGYPSTILTIVNTIIGSNSSGIYRDTTYYSPTLALSYNCVFGNTAYDYSGLTDPTGTDGNISADPLFVDAPGGDYHLKAASPCINAGEAGGNYVGQTDMDGEPRVAYGRVDIGADEFLYRGGLDFDLDTDVDITDFGFFRACFAGPNRPYPNVALCPQADLDGDADVDVADFLKLQACFNGPNRPPKCE